MHAVHSKQKSLLAMAVGREGGPSPKLVLKYFSSNVFDVIFFHWDKRDNREDWVERHPWAFETTMKHVFDPGKSARLRATLFDPRGCVQI